jgi:hypothetical protein
MDMRFRPAILVTAFINELSTTLGGEDQLTPQQKAIMQRVAWLHRRLQELEAEYASGQGLDANEYTTLTGSLFTGLKMLGLKRIARDTQTLASIRAEYAAKDNAP